MEDMTWHVGQQELWKQPLPAGTVHTCAAGDLMSPQTGLHDCSLALDGVLGLTSHADV